jgi:hypothetical protein
MKLGGRMSSNHNNGDDEQGRILPFRRREPPSRVGAFSNLSADESPVQDIGKYDRSDDTDDYAHRMKMNALAVLVLAVLIGGGMWIVDTMAQMRKNQDCVLMGRRNCGQVNLAPEVRSTAPVNAPLVNR